MVQLQEATIKAQCKQLRMPVIAARISQRGRAGGAREEESYRISGSVTGSGVGRAGTEHHRAPDQRSASAAGQDAGGVRLHAVATECVRGQDAELAEGGYLERAEPILFIGECGTGKTHLLTGLCVAACRQKKRVRFATAAALVNELVEAKHQLQLRRVLARWSRYDLIAIDEVGYVPLGGSRGGVPVPGDCGASRESGSDHDDQSAVFRVDAGDSERPAL